MSNEALLKKALSTTSDAEALACIAQLKKRGFKPELSSQGGSYKPPPGYVLITADDLTKANWALNKLKSVERANTRAVSHEREIELLRGELKEERGKVAKFEKRGEWYWKIVYAVGLVWFFQWVVSW